MPEPFFNFSYPPFSIPPPVQEQVAALSDAFAIAGNFLHCETINSGHINMTFRATCLEPDGTTRRYIFQRVNGVVFPCPRDVMHNVEKVTNHIRWKMLRVLKTPFRQTLNLYSARGAASIWKFPVPASGAATTALKTPTRSTWRTIPARLTKRPGFRRFPTAPVRHESGGHP